jgi:Flp pilus assembly protein TadB
VLEGLGGRHKASHNAASRRTMMARKLKKGHVTMHLGDPQKGSDSARDETVWFSFLCVAVAFGAAYKHPSVGINFVLLLTIGWFVWSLWKMTADRFE